MGEETCPKQQVSKRPAFIRLLALATQRKGLVSFSLVMSAASGILALAPAYLLYELSDILLAEIFSEQAVWSLISLIAVLFAARWVSLAAAIGASHIAAYGTLYDVRMAIVTKLTRIPLGAVTERTSGTTKKILQDDVERIELFIAHILPDIAAAFISPLFAVICLFYLDWRLGVAAIASLPLSFITQSIMYRRSDTIMDDYLKAHEQMNSALVQFIQGIPVIKSFGLTARSFSQLSGSVENYRDLIAAFARQAIPLWSGFQVSLKANMIFMLPVGGYLAMQELISIPVFILSMTLGLGLISPLMRIMYASGMLRQIEQGVNRIDEILETEEQHEISKGNLPEGHDLAFNHVSFSYEDNHVIKDVSFNVKSGAMTAIVGPSGAGKSTLAHLAGRLWDVEGGSITLGGIDIREMPLEDLSKYVSFVFQDVFLFDDTIAGNIGVADPRATEAEIIEACKAARAHEFIEALPEGYDTRIGERGTRLSGGERQRLSIARAILRNAPLLILDEATAYADVLNEAGIMSALDELTRNKTVLMIAHRLETVRKAGTIVVLDNGTVKDLGTHEELMERCSLYQRQWADMKRGQGEEGSEASS